MKKSCLIEKIITAIESGPTGFALWSFSFLGIIIARLLVENWIGKFQNRSALLIFYEFSHNFLFFLIAYILFVLLLKKILKVDLARSSNIMLWGYLIILTPPIIDHFISRGKGFWSFYKFDGISGLIGRFFTFFGDKPEIGITYGVRIEVAAVIILIFAYSLFKLYFSGKNWRISVIYSFISAIFSYLVLFFLGTFPSYITIIIQGFKKGFLRVSEIDVAQMFLTPGFLFNKEIFDVTTSFNLKMSLVYSLLLSLLILSAIYFHFREKMRSFLSNVRLPQIAYHIGLLVAGLGLGLMAKESNFSNFSNYFSLFNLLGAIVLFESVVLSWLASVIINDIFDIKIDRESNDFRPLIKKTFWEKEYATIGILLFLFSLFFAAIVSVKIMLLLFAYQAIAWIYSAWPFRLKRFAFVSTFASAMASILIFISGYVLISPEQSIREIPASIIALLMVGLSFSLPLKDFKDAEGDKKDGVYTIPVVFGEYWGKIIVGSGIFFSFLLSVLVFNEPKLFGWALFLGGISFWLIVKMSTGNKIFPDKKNSYSEYFVNYRNIFWWILGTVLIYGIILVNTSLLQK